MQRKFRIRVGFSRSDNRKSKIQNRKLVGIIALVVTLADVWGCGSGATASENLPNRIPKHYLPLQRTDSP